MAGGMAGGMAGDGDDKDGAGSVRCCLRTTWASCMAAKHCHIGRRI